MSASGTHEVLQSSPGAPACLLGNVAIVRGALEAGVQFVSCYPGTPGSEVGDTFARIAGDTGIFFEYSVNEKIAVEIAFAASLTRARSLCSMKHLGLNYAGDPVSTIPYVGVEGGMVIVSAGDPSAITSPNEQDQRHFSSFLYYPVFDPATPEDALEMTRFAFPFSEETRLPVLMRPTTRVCHIRGMVTLGALPETRNEIRFDRNPSRHVPIPVNARRMRMEVIDRMKLAETLLADSKFYPRSGNGPHGIIASGVAHAYIHQVIQDLELQDRVSLLQIGAYPVPEKILTGFLATVESVLVAEELTPFVEDRVTLAAYRNRMTLPINGKATGHFPLAFEYTPELVEDAVRKHVHLEKRKPATVSVPDLPPRPPVLCPGCPHRTTFYLARKVFGKKTVYPNDIGCYTLGYGTPLESCDVLLCMGSSISQASGIARTTGERTVAYIGDSTFFHSGLPALANAVRYDDNVTVFILDNLVTAMTGFQPSFSASDRLSIENTVRGLGVKDVYTVNQFDIEETREALNKAKAGSGLNVVICNAPCEVNRARLGTGAKRPPLTIDQERCNACSLCVRVLGCPAIHVEDERFLIDEDLCNGCGLCAHVCNQDAIK